MRKVSPADEIPVWMIEPDVVAAKIDHFKTKRVEDPDTMLCQQEMVDYVYALDGKRADTHKWVAKTHELADRFMRAYKDYVVCRKGCAHCCQLPVGMTFFEAEYIASRSGRKLNRKAKQITDIKPNKHNTTLCPFLDTDTATCSIYEYRPLACRMFATIDSHLFCEDIDVNHSIVTTEVSQAFQFSTATMVKAVMAVMPKQAAFSELRQWFR